MIADHALTLWSAYPDGRFRFKVWPDDHTVVYDITSGDTHVVDALAMEILHLLQLGSDLSTEALVTDLRDVFEHESDAEIGARVEHGLYRLRRIGLVAELSS